MAHAIAIDCDPGLDDAIAIALAEASPALSVALLTTVEGNAPLATVTANASAIIGALGAAVPIHAGLRAGVPQPARLSTAIWGGDGSLGLSPGASPVSPDAVHALARWLEAGGGSPRTVVAIGPLTNIAALLAARPDLASRLKLVIMGGALDRGNATPHAELNIWVDPEAAAAVLASPVEAEIVPLDITRRVLVGDSFRAMLAAGTTAAAGLSHRLMPLVGLESHPSAIHDACAIGLMLWPELFRLERGTMSVDTDPGPEEGRTRFSPGGNGRHRIATDLDIAGFIAKLGRQLSGQAGLT